MASARSLSDCASSRSPLWKASVASSVREFDVWSGCPCSSASRRARRNTSSASAAFALPHVDPPQPVQRVDHEVEIVRPRALFVRDREHREGLVEVTELEVDVREAVRVRGEQDRIVPRGPAAARSPPRASSARGRSCRTCDTRRRSASRRGRGHRPRRTTGTAARAFDQELQRRLVLLIDEAVERLQEDGVCMLDRSVRRMGVGPAPEVVRTRAALGRWNEAEVPDGRGEVRVDVGALTCLERVELRGGTFEVRHGLHAYMGRWFRVSAPPRSAPSSRRVVLEDVAVVHPAPRAIVRQPRNADACPSRGTLTVSSHDRHGGGSRSPRAPGRRSRAGGTGDPSASVDDVPDLQLADLHRLSWWCAPR